MQAQTYPSKAKEVVERRQVHHCIICLLYLTVNISCSTLQYSSTKSRRDYPVVICQKVQMRRVILDTLSGNCYQFDIMACVTLLSFTYSMIITHQRKGISNVPIK